MENDIKISVIQKDGINFYSGTSSNNESKEEAYRRSQKGMLDQVIKDGWKIIEINTSKGIFHLGYRILYHNEIFTLHEIYLDGLEFRFLISDNNIEDAFAIKYNDLIDPTLTMGLITENLIESQGYLVTSRNSIDNRLEVIHKIIDDYSIRVNFRYVFEVSVLKQNYTVSIIYSPIEAVSMWRKGEFDILAIEKDLISRLK